MKLLPLCTISVVLGAGVGAATAYVGEPSVDARFAPPADASAGESGGSLPVVEVDATTFDFGTMQRGAVESHEFLFTNSGAAPLRLEVGPTSCKCTLGEVPATPLPPGGSAPVRVEWIAKTGSGRFEQTATVITTDPRRPRVELLVTGQVVDATGREPQEFLLGGMSTGDQVTESVYVAAYGDEPISATARIAEGARNPESYRLSVEAVPTAELPLAGATSGVRIDLTAGPGLPVGRLTEWVVVTTSLDEVGAVHIPVIADVKGDVSIHGARWSRAARVLNLGSIASAEGGEANLFLSFKGEHAEGGRAEVGVVEPEWLEVELGEPEQKRPGVTHQPLIVRVPAGRPPVIRSDRGQGEGDARIELLTNLPSTPEVDMRVRFLIAN